MRRGQIESGAGGDAVDGFEELPENFSCVADYADLEPYAIVPAEAFYPPNEVINLKKWRTDQ